MARPDGPHAQSEAYFRAVLDAAPDAMIITDRDGRLSFANRQTEVLFRCDREELIGRSVDTLVPDRHRGEHAALREEYVRKPRTRRMGAERLLFARRPDGTEFPVEISLSPITTPEGLMVVSAIRDSSESRRELRMRDRAIANAATAFCFADFNGRVTSVNRAFVKMWGYDQEEEIVGLMNSDLSSDPAEVREVMEVIRSGGWFVGEVKPLRRDGSSFDAWISASAVLDDDGSPLCTMATFWDITRQKTVERQQAAVAELGKTALNGTDLDELMTQAVTVVSEILDAEYCKVLECLPDGQSLRLRAGVGWKPDLVGVATVTNGADSQAGYTLDSDEPVIVEDLTEEERFSGPPLLQEHGVVSGISVVIYGHRMPYGVFGVHSARRRVYTEDDANFVQGVANVIADAIERKRLDARLADRRALAALGHMTAAIAHDIKSPLAGISGAIQLYMEKLEEGDDDRKLFEMVLTRIASASDIIDQTLAYARPRNITKTPVSMLPCLESVVAVARSNPEAEGIDISVRGDDVILSCDALQIGPVFENILTNAVQAVDRGGRVEIEITKNDRTCDVVVADTGPGIPADDRTKIFEPFFTSKSTGTGLGLATAKRIIDAHEGSIRVECPSEGGTRVIVTLPL